MKWILPFCLWVLINPSIFASDLPIVVSSDLTVSPATMGVVINRRDPLSRQIAEYYLQAHNIPRGNIVEVDLPIEKQVDRTTFDAQYEIVKNTTPDHIQAYALAFMKPYRVDCLSITTAFTFGFDPRFCASGCRTTRYSPYFNSSSRAPWRDHKIRPSMALAARDLRQAKRLIDRGTNSRRQPPESSSGFVMQTSDKARSVRRLSDSELERLNDGAEFQLIQENGNELRGVSDLMFYFTGLTKVSNIDRNIYLPGAIADHLTSWGGALDEDGQMSALKWIEAGASGSYGTVQEPCNFTAKFPNPARVIETYRRGETLIEAYWKSVAMPGQGIFIGDPLAQPWGGHKVELDGAFVNIQSHAFVPGRYEVSTAEESTDTFQVIGAAQLTEGDKTISIPKGDAEAFLKIRRIRGTSR